MKTVLITGCSSGIGRETALYFHKKGWRVAATIRRPEAASELSGLENLRCYKLDVTDAGSIRSCIAQVVKDFGTIDALVNNAGAYATDPLEMMSDEKMCELINTNVLGTLRMSREIFPLFRTQKYGTIVNIASVAGRTTVPFSTVYHTSKWAVEGFSEALTYEARDVNVRVKVVEPGMVKTDLYKRVGQNPGRECPREYQHSYTKWLRFLHANYAAGYDPAIDAKTVYKAVTDRSKRLRYTSDRNTRILLFLRATLKQRAYNAFMRRLIGI